MKSADRAPFAEMLSAVAEVYRPEKPLDANVIAIYWHALASYDLTAVRQAFDRHVKNPDSGQFMPKPADLIRMMSGTSHDSALQAWAKVDKAVRSIGPYIDVVFDDALIHRVIQEMGGWIALCSKDSDEWPFVGKEFENRYRGFKQRNETPEYPAILIGISGGANRRGGYAVDPPTYVGDPSRAAIVCGGGTDKPIVGFIRANQALTIEHAPRLKG